MRVPVGVLTVLTFAACGGGPPQPLAADQIPAAFIALTQAPDRTMHMEWTGTYKSGQLEALTLPFNAVLDFAGNNYAGTIAVPGNRDKGGVLVPAPYTEIAFVDGQAYQRTSYQGVWQHARTQPRSFDPFHGLSLGQIAYVGLEQRDDGDMHHLRLIDASPLAALLFDGPGGAMPGPVRFAADSSTFDFLVDANGRPVSAALELASAQDPNDFSGPSVSATYKFSNWGAEIYIIPPPSPR
jgi:hypothetical protein